jgi:hypothetical protein
MLSTLAQRYQAYVLANIASRGHLAETELLEGPDTPLTELEWQSRWFAGDFGQHFLTTTGEPVEIVQFGWWNHGAGPDFRDCSIRYRGEVLRGSIELDPVARDWEHHGHAVNPAYEDVVLHLFFRMEKAEFFTRTAAHRLVPQVLLDGKSPTADAGIQPSSKPGRCSLSLMHWAPNRVAGLFEAAARYRLELKSARWQRVINAHGWDQAVFQALAETLGYANNKLPMTVLSQRLPLTQLKAHPEEREARCFGSAGFLDGFNFDQADTVTKSYLRTLWEVWWKHRAAAQPERTRPALAWNGSAVRPMNHPQRRVAALSEMAAHWPQIRRRLQPAEAFVEKEFRATLDSLRHPYWDFHYTLTSNPATKRMALIGASRVGDILSNVVFPLLIPQREPLWRSYCERKAPLDNEKTKRAALRLFGTNVVLADEFTSKLFHHQALLQLYQDFCCQDSSDCAHCPFPEQMSQWA